MQKLHGPQFNHPLIRVVQGLENWWESSIVNMRCPSIISAAAWSPCGRFIAVTWWQSLDIIILDPTTLEQLYTMHPLSKLYGWALLIFSPGGNLLTGYSSEKDRIATWDLQTGGQVSNIKIAEAEECESMVYSGCGTMIGALLGETTIATYNVLSGMCISSHSVQQPIIGTMWTCGKDLQFSTLESGSITIWKVNFTSGSEPTKLHSLHTPYNLSRSFALLPTPSRLAFILEARVLVWDCEYQKVLLDSTDVIDPKTVAFSTDGCFLMCGTKGHKFYIWKDSLDGYLLHQKLACAAPEVTPIISPDEKSIVSFGRSILQLWHITNFTTTLPGISAPSHNARNFLVELSPNELLIATAKRLSNQVTVLNLKSGSPWLVIDTDTKILGVRITSDKVITVGNKNVITWDLPTEDCMSGTRRNTSDSVQLVDFECPDSVGLQASISSDLNYFALGDGIHGVLYLYNMHTGKKLARFTIDGQIPGFIPDRNEIWLSERSGVLNQWEIVETEENGSNVTKLKRLEVDIQPSSGFPWHSPDGYQVTDDGWVLGSSGRQLLWLPHYWWPFFKTDKLWGRRHLVIWNDDLPDPIVFNLEV